MVEEHFYYTPIAYVYNNPINFISLLGLETIYYETQLQTDDDEISISAYYLNPK